MTKNYEHNGSEHSPNLICSKFLYECTCCHSQTFELDHIFKGLIAISKL